jgi:hypothetical protein
MRRTRELPSAQHAGPPVLGYASGPKKGLNLEEADGRVVVTFPVAPKWFYVLPIVVQIVAGLMYVAMGIMLVIFIHQFHVPVLRFLRTFVGVISGWALTAVVWEGFGFYAWFMYRRWGRVPRVLTADESGLVLSWLGWWWIRERRWPAEEITALELRVIKGHLNPWRTVAVLHVRRLNGRTRRFRLSSADPELPRRIAQRFSEILARPLICRS